MIHLLCMRDRRRRVSALRERAHIHANDKRVLGTKFAQFRMFVRDYRGDTPLIMPVYCYIATAVVRGYAGCEE